MDKNWFVMDYLTSHVNLLYRKALSEHRTLQAEQPGTVEVKPRSQSVASLKNHKYDDNVLGMESPSDVFLTDGKNGYRSGKVQSDHGVGSQSKQTNRLEKLLLGESPAQPFLRKLSYQCLDVNKSFVGESVNTCNIAGVNKDVTCASQNNTHTMKTTESDKNGVWPSRNVASHSHGRSNISSTNLKISHKSHRRSLCASKINEKTCAEDNGVYRIFSGARDMIRRNDDIKQKTKIINQRTDYSEGTLRGDAPVRNSGKVLVDPQDSSYNLSGERTLLSLGRSSSSISLSDEESCLSKSDPDTDTHTNLSECNGKNHKIKTSKKVSDRWTGGIRSTSGSSSTEDLNWYELDITRSSSGDDSNDKHHLGQWGKDRIEGCSHVNKILPAEEYSLRLPPKHSSLILPVDYLPSTEAKIDSTVTSGANNGNFPILVDHTSLPMTKQDLTSQKQDLTSSSGEVTLASPEGEVTLTSPEEVALTSPVGEVTLISPEGEVALTSPEEVTLTSLGEVTLTSPGETTLTSPEGEVALTSPGEVILTSPEDLTLPDPTVMTPAVGLSMLSPVRDFVMKPPDKVMSPGNSPRTEHQETTSEVLPLTTENIDKLLGHVAKGTKDTDSDNNSIKSCVVWKAGIRRQKMDIEDKMTENKLKMRIVDNGNRALENGLSNNGGKRKRLISSDKAEIQNHTKRSRNRSTNRFEEHLGDCTDLKHKKISCKLRSESCPKSESMRNRSIEHDQRNSTNVCYKGQSNQRSVGGDNIKKNVRKVIVSNKMKTNPLVIKGGKTRSACRKYVEKKQEMTEKHCKQRRILQNHEEKSCADPASIEKLNYLERKTLVSDSESVIRDVHYVMPLVDVTQWSNGMKTYKMLNAASSSSTDSDSKHHPGGIWKSIFQEN